MTEFHEQDLTGARFERVSLRGATFTRVENFPVKECLRIVLNEEWSTGSMPNVI